MLGRIIEEIRNVEQYSVSNQANQGQKDAFNKTFSGY